MSRSATTLGLALLSALALGAAWAQTALAVEHTFTSDAVVTSRALTGSQETGTKDKFTFTSVSFSCASVTFAGTMPTTDADHLRLVPTYKECSGGALGAATVTNEGCAYTLDSDTTDSSHFPAEKHAPVTLDCGDTGAIKFVAGGCTVTLETTHSSPAPNTIVNHNLDGARYSVVEQEGKDALTIKWTLRTLKATSLGANCILVGLSNPGTHSNGTYSGVSTVSGFEDLGDTGGHSFEEGERVDLGLDQEDSSQHTFTSEVPISSRALTGAQEAETLDQFTFTGKAVTCASVTFAGTMPTTDADHLRLVPTYKECIGFAGLAATVTNEGCAYTLDSDTTESSHFPGEEHARVTLDCGDTGAIRLAAAGCTVSLETTHSSPNPNTIVNHNLDGARYSVVEHEGKDALTIKWTVRTLKATTQGANCILLKLGNPGTHSNGSYDGVSIISAFEDLGDSGGHSFIEGERVDLGLTTP